MQVLAVIGVFPWCVDLVLWRQTVDYSASPPLLGEHTEEVLGELGLSVVEVARLRERGVVV